MDLTPSFILIVLHRAPFRGSYLWGGSAAQQCIVTQLCLILCNPVDCNHQCSSSLHYFRRIMGPTVTAYTFYRFPPGCLQINWLVRSCVCVCAQSCLTLCNPMDYSLQGSAIHGIFQARILGWVAISSSREYF